VRSGSVACATSKIKHQTCNPQSRVGRRIAALEVSLLRTFERAHAECDVIEREAPITAPYTPLRRGAIDVLVNWRPGNEPDLVAGPVIDHQPRVLAVATDHSLARQASVSVEDIANFAVATPIGLPDSVWRRLVPAHTPSGRAIVGGVEVVTMSEIFVQVARGRIVHPTVRSMATLYPRDDVAFVPIHDMPALELMLIWVAAHENARIGELVRVAESRPDGSR
jgi:hypothetical protein